MGVSLKGLVGLHRTFQLQLLQLLVGAVTRVYVPWFFVSSQQRFGVTDIKAPSAFRSWIDRVIALRSQMDRVIAQCYSSILEDSRKIHL